MPTEALIWGTAAAASAGVMVRPFGWPEAVWAVLAAAALVLTGILPWQDALAAVGKGADVYLFLVGMMLLAETARQEGLFEYLAFRAVREAKGSSTRLFRIVYGVGTVVTVFLSNDATAVVLTPAVYAAATAARVDPLPHLFVCAFIANAASFVLPISNPANLVVYGEHMPPLTTWLAHFAFPSAAAIVSTYAALRWALRRDLRQPVRVGIEPVPLGGAGRLVAAGIGATAVLLMAASALGLRLGLPTFAMGVAVAAAVLTLSRQSPLPVLKHVSWSVLPLVAGLFVLVEALARAGAFQDVSAWLGGFEAQAPAGAAAAAGAGAAVALGSNVINNLPTGLIAASVTQSAQVSPQMTQALLVGVDLGPNLSVTGSLATVLWLIALRREGVSVSGSRFLALGMIVMPPALAAALAFVVL